MDKRAKILKTINILIIFIGISIITLSIFICINNSNKNSNDDKNHNNSSKNENFKRWYYVDFEFYDENDNMIEKPFNMENFYLDFHDKKVDVCYDKCYTTTYTKDNNILTIDDFDYFSAKFEVSYKDNMMLLKTVAEGAYIIYYFGKPINAE